jgi:phosphosulfolactate phosphohydrolase-like enzyme
LRRHSPAATSASPCCREIDDDIRFCARENVLDVIPRYDGMEGPAAEIRTFA